MQQYSFKNRTARWYVSEAKECVENYVAANCHWRTVVNALILHQKFPDIMPIYSR